MSLGFGQCTKKLFLPTFLILLDDFGCLVDTHNWKKEPFLLTHERLELIMEELETHISEQVVSEVVEEKRRRFCIRQRWCIGDENMWISLIIMLTERKRILSIGCVDHW